jgi:hypothetical protein
MVSLRVYNESVFCVVLSCFRTNLKEGDSMNGIRSPRKNIGKFACYSAILFAIYIFTTDLHAQAFGGDGSVQSKFVKAIVGASDGKVTVMSLTDGNIPPGYHPLGRIFLDPQLSFYQKSFFTALIGNIYYTNNDVLAPFPATARHLNGSGVSSVFKDVTGGGVDTIRTIWPKQSGIDIIQDIYCIDFTKSGQVVYKWRFTNTTGTPTTASCQFLQDIQITDPFSKQAPNSNDGPKILTKYQYDSYYTQFPNTTYNALPWFYIGFLFDLPNAPTYNPGLSAMGYIDYGAPLNLIKPFRYSNGDWYTQASNIYGPALASQGVIYNGNQGIGSDNAILVEFNPRVILPGQTIEVGRTSYGTGEYEKCIGQLFSIVFYPHHLVWSPNPAPGQYTPNPIHVEKFLVNPGPPQNVNVAANTKVTLNVSKDLTISDSLCKTFFGSSQQKPLPPSNGINIAPGGVAYFDWWACASPVEFCKGAVIDTLTFTASCGVCPPAFVDQIGNIGSDECQLTLTIDCAELDHDPPAFSDSLGDCHATYTNVHDWRTTDRGLASITWVPTPKAVAKFTTNPSKFTITVTPPILPCFTDKANHVVTITKTNPADSTINGSFDFTYTDCIGNVSTHTVYIDSCVLVAHPDTLPPVYTMLWDSGTYDPKFKCSAGNGDNNRIYRFAVADNRKYDLGVDSIEVIGGTGTNMNFTSDAFTKCVPHDTAFFTLSVKDSMFDGSICIRTFDCAKPKANYADTCIHYCTIPDTLAPIVVITKDPVTAGLWHVCVYDDRPWDRHIDEIFIVGAVNISLGNIPNDTLRANTTGKDSVCFDLIGDSTKISSFCIEAVDLAGNKTKPNEYCSNQTISKDTLCPNIVITPALNTNPDTITVNVNDIHHNSNGSLYVWDSGIDSVWFTNNKGMTVPSTIHGLGAKTVPAFTIGVQNPYALDSVACVTINAKDIAGNVCSETFCYPYVPDHLCPVITLWYNPLDSDIYGLVSDSSFADRGLSSINLAPQGPYDNVNFAKLIPNGQKVVSLAGATRLIRPSHDMSTVGTLTSLDLAGASGSSEYPPGQHTASVSFAIWVQDFALLPGILPNQSSKFQLPIYFVKNDSFAVIQKGITDFTITCSLTGNIGSIQFDSLSTYTTETAKWNMSTPTVTPNTIVITGSMPAGGPPLSAAFPDSLVVLKFHSLFDLSTRNVTIKVTSVQFNGGLDSVYKGSVCSATPSKATMPAPMGSISGSNIVITGECAPLLLTSNGKPTEVSLDPNHPNPFSHTTTFNYTVPHEGAVQLAIYDELGNEVVRLVDQVQKQGIYTLTFDASKIAAGNYLARLQTSGVVVSRKIGVEK